MKNMFFLWSQYCKYKEEEDHHCHGDGRAVCDSDAEDEGEILTADFAALFAVDTHVCSIIFTAILLRSPPWTVRIIVFAFCEYKKKKSRELVRRIIKVQKLLFLIMEALLVT